jgi:hypothetical protein
MLSMLVSEVHLPHSCSQIYFLEQGQLGNEVVSFAVG